jgi:exodeoxyribonuclease VII large subunit
MDLFSSPEGAPPDEVISVSDLARTAAQLLRQGMSDVWVKGEVIEYKVWKSGHHYFCLRDAASQMRCVLWRNDAKSKVPLADGTEVYAFGRAGLWEEKSEFRFTARMILPTSAMGAAQRELERVKAVLLKDGLLDPSRKRGLPAYPLRVAVVTSIDGAALRDMVTITRKRWPLASLLVVPARVQGADAPQSIASALALVNRLDALDLCVLGRGGGARDDLFAFNTEVVCRALAAVRVPTISAVGHETDISLTDLVADVRAATPSAAMEMALPDTRSVRRELDDAGVRLASLLSRRCRLAAERVERYSDRYRAAMEATIVRRRHRLEQAQATLEALSPLRVLERGYSVAQGPDGRVLSRTADFTVGSPFRLRLSDGRVAARVEEET